MTQRNNGAVSFQADGKTYTLVCDMNALIDFEAEFQLKAFDLLSGELEDLSLVHMRGLFWAMLQEHHPEIDQRAAGKLMLHAEGKMADAIRASFPTPSKDEKPGKIKASPRKAR